MHNLGIYKLEKCTIRNLTKFQHCTDRETFILVKQYRALLALHSDAI